jgi:signal transduction histidine kinase
VRSSGWLVVAMISAVASAVPAASAPLSRSVLIIDQTNPGLPFYAAIGSAIRSTLSVARGERISVYEEYLDLNRFGGERQDQVRNDYFREKYRDNPIGVIITLGTSALKFTLRSRAAIWPGTPVVFAAVEKSVGARWRLPSDVTGTLIDLSFAQMLDTARRVVPNLKRVVMVGEPWDRSNLHRSFKDQLSSLPDDIKLIDLRGLSVLELKKRLASLPDDAAILYTGIIVDGAGVSYTSAEALTTLAAVANRPIVIDLESFLGRGAIGGFLLSGAPIGQEAARLALRLLDGESIASMPVTQGGFTAPVFDWNEVQRWKVSEARLPADSELRYRPAGLWLQYRWQAIATLIVLSFQAGLIAWLLFERRRRYLAELDSRRHLLEVIHLNRSATAGALSASIAHELNQPLGAILSNAEAAEVLLTASPLDVEQLKEILGDIRQADQRAGDIIAHLRRLLKRGKDSELQEFDLNDAVQHVIHILAPEATKRGVEVTAKQVQAALPVHADQIHLEQVILNLAMNGMDAMLSALPEMRRMAFYTTLVGREEVEVAVSDSGTGIPQDKLNAVFETFYTTKPQGTGLGLSIARTIIETYGGKIWAENRIAGGAIFRFTLPLKVTHSVRTT